MKKILVVGGAGYIGSHQVKLLDELGYGVVVYDNLSNSVRESVLVEDFYEADLSDTDMLTRVFEEHDFDAVMHFAGFIDIYESSKHPAEYYKNNVSNVINLLEVMLKFNVKKIIYSSSAAVYGLPNSIPINEYHNLEPVSTYGSTKMMVERIIKDFEFAYDFKYSILRYFNAAGAHESGQIGENHNPETHLIPTLLKAALGKINRFYIYGNDYETKDGTCIRDFIHVCDLVNAHVKALEDLFENNTSSVFNLGSGKGCSIKEIVKKVKEITGIDFEIAIAERRYGDPAQMIADYSKAKKRLNWEPQYSLDDIIESAWKWMKKNYS